ncbi:protein OS-9 isoform X2 [Parasteatoda tepidariorum]|nr:protein OS-9 isoform X2 [Parasteatoda tepidariorum]
MTSKSGKEYECYIPKPNESLSESDSKNGKSIDIQKLLEPMYEGSCLYKIKDWWTYELCFGKAIKQFHIEDGRIAGEILTLGLYELDNKWEDELYEEKFERVKPHHAQSYVNGTKCDLTGLPRNTEVKIFCEEDSLDYINWITEPETCNYVITVHTSLLCSHPLFKSSKELHTIVCQPSGID